MRYQFFSTIRNNSNLIVAKLFADDFTTIFSDTKEYCKKRFNERKEILKFEIESLCSVEDRIQLELIGGINKEGKMWDDLDYTF